jgi:hypothetical protein
LDFFFFFDFMCFLEVFVFFFTEDSFVIGGIINNVLVIGGGTLSQLKVYGGHCQFGGSLRGVCGLLPPPKKKKERERKKREREREREREDL